MQVENLRICLLGDFSLDYANRPQTENSHGVHTARLQALLAYLLLHRHAPQPRQHLAFLFWPDTGEAQALTNLRNLLHKLRMALPQLGCFLQANMQTVQWQPDAPFTLDIADFEATLAQEPTCANLERAVQLYNGDLLPSCYDDWILPERERLRQQMIGALERLINLLEKKYDYHAAIQYSQRLLEFDPFNEATYRTLMRLHAANNDRAGALHVYQQCVEILQREFAAEPTPATQEFYQRLQHQATMPPARTADLPAQPPLVGRMTEWSALLDSWYRASSGNAHCLLLSGDAGIGKTRLAEELLAWVERQGFVTAIAHCYAAEGALAYAPVVAWLHTESIRKRLSALDPVWLTEVARLLPDLLAEWPHLPPPSPLTAGWQRQRLFEALARAFLNASAPLLLFIDDLQWCDRDTLEWLHYLLRFAQERQASDDSSGRLLLISTARSEEMSDNAPLSTLLFALRQTNQLTERIIGPLDAAETSALANAVAGQQIPPEQTASLYQETEGNPLFVVEMVRSGSWPLVTGDRRNLAEHAFPIAQYPLLPPKLHAVIQARLAHLSPNARELVGVAAAIGRAFSLAVLAKASNQADNVLVHSLDELCQRQIVRERSAGTYDFTHDKLRETTYNSLSAAKRRMLHRWVAQALETVYANKNSAGQPLDGVSGQVANHYELAGDFDKAILYYQQTAEAAHRIYANSDAIRAYRRALALLAGPAGEQGSQAVVLNERLGDILVATGQYDEARASFAQALMRATFTDRVHCARLHRKIGNTWREQYQYPNAWQFYTAAQHALENPTLLAPHPGQQTNRPNPAQGADSHPTVVQQSAAWWEEWIQIQLERDFVHYWLAEMAASTALETQLQPSVEQHATPSQRAEFFQRKGMLEFRRNRSVVTDEAMQCAQRAFAIYQDANIQENLPSAHFMLGFNFLWHGDLADAAEQLQIALQLAEQSSDISLQARALTYLAIVQRRRGDDEATRQCAARALLVATTAHMPEYIAMAKANEAWLAWIAGDDAAVAEQGCAALTLWQQLPATHASLPFQWTALWPLLAAALHAEGVETALNYGRALLDPHQQCLPAALTMLLEQAIHAWEQTDTATTRHCLNEAVCLAQASHYL